MLILRGLTALPEFRLQRLLSGLQLVQPAVAALSAEWIYFIHLEQRLDAKGDAALCDILKARVEALPSSANLCLVLPRTGTISPWSSKATDIVHNCGLTAIARLERGVAYRMEHANGGHFSEAELLDFGPLLHDRMIEQMSLSWEDVSDLFLNDDPKPFTDIDIMAGGMVALQAANRALGLALSDDEMAYFLESFQSLGRNATDVELMMFAQVNSEHCRHKIFNANWRIDGVLSPYSLFDMIKNTHQCHPEGTLSAYRDNAAVIEGFECDRFFVDSDSRRYVYDKEPVHILMKVETHNHPTGIAPFPGAATGSGGEIRDETATGTGAKPKAGLCGFSVSHLRIPGEEQPWEWDIGKPARVASALEIMLAGPIGAASFNNEFGRPGLLGYFRTFGIVTPDGHRRGYHKPIMLAGGLGNIREEHVQKKDLPPGAQIFVLGGPAMLIGLGGGAASSMSTGSSDEALDFASVQRSNPEMQRRCQEVVDRCWELGERNPILSVHDVGAGGLSNAVPEIVHASDRGGRFQLRAIPNDDPGMTPMQIWCNEAQERIVVAIAPAFAGLFTAICERERCPYALIGEASEEQNLIVGDGYFDNTPVSIPNDLILGKPPKMLREAKHGPNAASTFDHQTIDLQEAALRILAFPAVADKRFLITIGDRTVTGQVCRDQLVGPWQVAVADAAVTTMSYEGFHGEAMAMGERSPIALLDPAASARMAVAEAITNICSAPIADISHIRLSANWMAAAGHPAEEAGIYDAVHSLGMEFCPKIGVAIPVGKDSMSMKTVWQDAGKSMQVSSPLSVIIAAFARVPDCRKTLTPQLSLSHGPTVLLLIDLGAGKNRLGGSVFAQVYNTVAKHPADADSPEWLVAFFRAVQQLNQSGLVLAYHDRSDGGVWATLCEMAFAAHTGLTIQLDNGVGDVRAWLFNEELGAVLQVRQDDVEQVTSVLTAAGLGHCSHVIGAPQDSGDIEIFHQGKQVLRANRIELHRVWSKTSWRMQSIRDNPECARQEYDALLDKDDPGLNSVLQFDAQADITAPYVMRGRNPPLAILREQGVNGQLEMAAAFDKAGFACTDVHMSDILNGRVSFKDFVGFAACGGFSYGDVLGAGGGWAKSILYNTRARDEFEAFFHRTDSFALGVCNGCQMMSQLKTIIPGAGRWPVFEHNWSQQFEARLSLVEILPSPSLLLQEMTGSFLPVPVAHGEGRAVFELAQDRQGLTDDQLVTMRYVDNRHRPTEAYPANPNGSPGGITGVTTPDGRFTIMMPHPERAFRTVQYSWYPKDWLQDGPWLRLFRNARRWVD